MAYWPQTDDTRTATFSLAIDPTSAANGAIKFIPGSHKARKIREHKPIGKTREEAHAIAIAVDEAAEPVELAEVERGSVSVHNEYVVHGSGGNATAGNRRTYVVAFRTAETVAQERAAGFTHSHNDNVNWDNFRQWQDEKERKAQASKKY
jgi:ectoine hydroxylase-related dioxygenase (phytanoyl-CoA dioxygenase family)